MSQTFASWNLYSAKILCGHDLAFWEGADVQMAKMPADFLVDADGRILLAHYGNDIADHLSMAEIERALADS